METTRIIAIREQEIEIDVPTAILDDPAELMFAITTAISEGNVIKYRNGNWTGIEKANGYPLYEC